MNPRVGTHISFTENENLVEAILDANDMVDDYKIPCYQLYLGPKTTCNIRKLSEDDINISKNLIGEKGFYIHSSMIAYLTNREAFRKSSRKSYTKAYTKASKSIQKSIHKSIQKKHPPTKATQPRALDCKQLQEQCVGRG